jgi:5-methylcytosine-specific restriction endonuclease McrBC regulatory subunit McrC
MSEKWFHIKATKKERPLIGLFPSSEISVVIIPRFWLDEARNEDGKKIKLWGPPQFVQEKGILVLPDKGERWIRANESLSEELKNSNHFDVLAELSEKPVQLAEEDYVRDAEMVESLLRLAWVRDRFAGKSNLRDVPELLVDVLFADEVMRNVEERMNELRRVYNTRGSFTSTVKGRISFEKSISKLVVGLPELYCYHQEFSIESEHYSALMTCLEHIAANRPQNVEGIDHLNMLQSQRAKKLRGLFMEIPGLNTTQALSVLQNARTPPQLSHWSDIFQMAAKILTGQSKNDKGKVNHIPVEMQTDSLWEHFIVDKLIRLAFPTAAVINHAQMENPWQKATFSGEDNRSLQADKKPDYLVMSSETDLILDAKYRDGFSNILSSSGGQMLMYSLMPFVEEFYRDVPRKLGFVHPGKVLVARKSDARRLNPSIQLITDSKHANTLFGIEIPFPQPGQIHNVKDSNYWTDVASQIAEIINSTED